MLLCKEESAPRDKSPLESILWNEYKLLRDVGSEWNCFMEHRASVFQVIWIIILKKLFEFELKLIQNPIIMKTPIKVYCTVAHPRLQAINSQSIGNSLRKILKWTSFHVPITGICWWMVQHVVSVPKRSLLNIHFDIKSTVFIKVAAALKSFSLLCAKMNHLCLLLPPYFPLTLSLLFSSCFSLLKGMLMHRTRRLHWTGNKGDIQDRNKWFRKWVNVLVFVSAGTWTSCLI